MGKTCALIHRYLVCQNLLISLCGVTRVIVVIVVKKLMNFIVWKARFE